MKLLFTVFALLITLSSQITATPTATHIGRGTIQSVAWHEDRLWVSTPKGMWRYTAELEDDGYLPNIHLATLSPDGKYIAGLDEFGELRLWDAETFQITETVELNGLDRVRVISWSPDSRYLAAAGETNEAIVYIWHISNPSSIETYSATRADADRLVWSPGSNYLAVVAQESNDGFFVVDIALRNYIHLDTGRTFGVSSVVWQDDTYLLHVVAHEYTEITRWNVPENKEAGEFRSGLPFIKPNPTGTLLALPSTGSIILLDVTTDEARFGIDVRDEYLGTFSASWSRDGEMVAFGAFVFEKDKGTDIFIVDPDNGEILERLKGLEAGVEQLLWSDNDRYLIATDRRGRIATYDMRTYEQVANSTVHTTIGDRLAWSPDSEQVMVADTLGSAKLWDVETSTEMQSVEVGTLPVNKLKWQPGGSMVAIRSGDQFQMWDIVAEQDGAEEFGIESAPVYFVWSSDGQYFVTDEFNVVRVADQPLLDPFEIISTIPYPYEEDYYWSPSGRYILEFVYGIGRAYSPVYDVQTKTFANTYAFLSNGAAAWTRNDKLVSLSWGTWHGSPNYILPRLSRFAAPDFTPHQNNPDYQGFSLQGLTSSTNQGFLSPLGSFAAAVTVEGDGFVWDAATGTPLFMLADTHSVIWSPNEVRLAVQRTDGSIWILNSHGQIETRLPTSPDIQKPVGSLFWSPDNTKLAHLYNGVLDIWYMN
jgi:WD40 repeat protein